LVRAATLVVWSLIMLLWMAGTRLPARVKIGMDLSKSATSGRGAGTGLNLYLAWGYDISRIMQQSLSSAGGQGVGPFYNHLVIIAMPNRVGE
jgi:hypothetical protein